MKKIVIFAGPSIGRVDHLIANTQSRLDFELRPPGRAGDIINLVISNPAIDVIVLADGFFYETYSPMHREIIFAINSGIKVIGCSSMGAIRAVELEEYGMIGRGEVFTYYKNNPETSDDEVGLIHETVYPYKAITMPLINLRILALQTKNKEEEKAIQRSIDYFSKISFDKRFFNSKYYQDTTTEEQVKDIEIALKAYKDYKTNDLEKVVEELMDAGNELCNSSVKIKSKKVHVNDYILSGRYQTYQYLMAPHRIICEIENEKISETDIRDLLALGHQEYNEILSLAAIREILLEKAQEQDLKVEVKELEEFKLELMSIYGVEEETDLGKILKLTPFELNGFLHKEVLIAKSRKIEVNKQQSIHAIGSILDTLRASGGYPRGKTTYKALAEAKKIIKQMKRIVDQNTLAKMVKEKIILKNTAFNKIRIPIKLTTNEKGDRQITKRNEISEALMRIIESLY